MKSKNRTFSTEKERETIKCCRISSNLCTKRNISIKLLWFLICFSCLIIHLTFTIQRYLKYDIYSDVSISIPDTITPPGLSICFELVDLLIEEPEECADTLTAGIMIEDYDKCDTWLDQFPFDRVMNNMTYDLISRIESIESPSKVNHTHYDGNNYNGKRYGLSYRNHHVSEFYKDFKKCIRIVVPINGTVTIGQVTRWKSGLKTLLEVAINLNDLAFDQNRTFGFGTLIHERSKYPRVYDAHEQVIQYSKDDQADNEFQFVYTQITTQYLRNPYGDRCYDYSENESVESQGECLEKCTDKLTFERYRVRNRESVTTVYDSNPIGAIGTVFKSDVDESCMVYCRVDCTTHFYDPTFVTKFDDGNHFKIQVDAVKPKTTINHEPSFSLGDFVIYVAGSFGLWLGTSFYVTVTDLVRFFIYFKSN